MARNFKPEDEGKRVLTADGQRIGEIDRVSGTDAYVRPDQSVDKSMRRRLGWVEEGLATYKLNNSDVARFTDQEIHLADDL